MAEPVKMSADSNIPGAWIKGVESMEFKTLITTRTKFIYLMLFIFCVGFVGLSLLLSFQRPLMGLKVFGPLNLGFVLIIANYIMAWAIAIIYARVSERDHDPLIAAVIAQARKAGGKS